MSFTDDIQGLLKAVEVLGFQVAIPEDATALATKVWVIGQDVEAVKVAAYSLPGKWAVYGPPIGQATPTKGSA